MDTAISAARLVRLFRGIARAALHAMDGCGLFAAIEQQPRSTNDQEDRPPGSDETAQAVVRPSQIIGKKE